MPSNRFAVTVWLVHNNDKHKRRESHSAYDVRVRDDGFLDIFSEEKFRAFGNGTWKKVEVRPIKETR